MAGELVNKIEQLRKKVIEFGNKRFKKEAVEIISKDNASEDLFLAPAQLYSDTDEAQPEIKGTPEPVLNPDLSLAEQPVPEKPEAPARHEEPLDPRIVFMKIETMIRKSIAEEQEAAAVYVERAAKCLKRGEHRLARLFEELAGDEIVHAASLETALDMYGLFDPYKFIEGQEEAEYLLQESEDDIAKKEEKARVEADKVRKEFDFVAEYTKDKASYEKEKIINSINDLILGKSDLENVVQTVMQSAKAAKKKIEKDDKKEKKAEQ